MGGRRAIPWVFGLFVLGLVLATHAGTHDSGAAVSSTLHGSVGPGFDISLTYDDGSPVSSPPAGSYRVVVNDLTPDHNFHLIGPGVDMSTGTAEVGSETWTVTFQNNSQYLFQCDTHPAEMNGTFAVGQPATTSTRATPTTLNTGHPPMPLTASVNSSTALLDIRGKRATSVTAGRYEFEIKDSSAKAGFELQHVGFAAKALTTAVFVGRHVATITLTAGTWKYYASAHAASAVAFTVTAAK